MEQQLQTLLDKIYQEGVNKGQEKAEQLINEARQKADNILREAEKEADEIRKKAQKENEELSRNVTSELDLAARQSISALKQQISRLITSKIVSEPLHTTFSDEDFLKRTIEQLIQNWREQDDAPSQLSLFLPPDQEDKLYQYFSAKSKEVLNGGLEVNFDGKLTSGFRIGPSDGNYIISFTDKDFEAFFLDYLRPRTKKLLFNGE